MLLFLAEELSNSAYYYTTCANVNKHDSRDVKMFYSMEGNTSWKPSSYKK